jgi:NAD(P)-dependent dehydrogenase (short-subunit alcohol dehydrogenase family)
MKNVLLIGGSGGIGQKLIELFNGDKYIVVSCSSKDLTLPDITNRHGLDEIDIVINLASLTTHGDLSIYSSENKIVLDVNCLGPINILSKFLPYMRDKKYGRIIMMSSVYSSINIPGEGVYSASKAFVDKLVKIAAIENAQYGITVNSIQLGYTGIGMGTLALKDIDKAINKSAMKRFCTMEELYKTIEFIIDTEYLTGQNIRLDGGIR